MFHSGYLRFEWDEAKHRANKRKHGISFDEAETVFLDAHARLKVSADHPDDECRFLLMGISNKSRLLVVVHTWLEDDRMVRIISARKATNKERFQYRGFL
jgi:uncharacterized DUF497 family protein